VIVGADKDRLLSGISVLEGKSADLTAGADGSVATTPKAGSFLFAAMNKLPDSEAAPLKQAKSIVMDLGEADREIYADLSLETRTAKDATNLVAVMQGGWPWREWRRAVIRSTRSCARYRLWPMDNHHRQRVAHLREVPLQRGEDHIVPAGSLGSPELARAR
jgi:hypothetical protein